MAYQYLVANLILSNISNACDAEGHPSVWYNRAYNDLHCGLSYRFNLTFDEKEVEDDDAKVNSDEACRPEFSDIEKVSGFLDKELEASGFTRKEQVDIEKVQLSVLSPNQVSLIKDAFEYKVAKISLCFSNSILVSFL